MVNIYASISGTAAGCFFDITPRETTKHWTHVLRSFIGFFLGLVNCKPQAGQTSNFWSGSCWTVSNVPCGWSSTRSTNFHYTILLYRCFSTVGSPSPTNNWSCNALVSGVSRLRMGSGRVGQATLIFLARGVASFTCWGSSSRGSLNSSTEARAPAPGTHPVTTPACRGECTHRINLTPLMHPDGNHMCQNFCCIMTSSQKNEENLIHMRA